MGLVEETLTPARSTITRKMEVISLITSLQLEKIHLEILFLFSILKCNSLSTKREDNLWGVERRDMHVDIRKLIPANNEP